MASEAKYKKRCSCPDEIPKACCCKMRSRAHLQFLYQLETRLEICLVPILIQNNIKHSPWITMPTRIQLSFILCPYSVCNGIHSSITACRHVRLSLWYQLQSHWLCWQKWSERKWKESETSPVVTRGPTVQCFSSEDQITHCLRCFAQYNAIRVSVPPFCSPHLFHAHNLSLLYGLRYLSVSFKCHYNAQVK